MKTEIRAQIAIWSDTVQIIVRATADNGQHSYAQPLTLKTIDPGAVVGEPTLALSKDDAQQWIDELWRVGLRPSEGAGSAGSLAATERHLADMRDVAFGALVKAGIHSGGKP